MSAVSPAVTNGPSEQNGEGEQVWERPWSLEEIRKTSANWSLAADSGLFLFLQDFSQRMLSKTHEIEKQLDGLIRDTKATDCCLHTVFNDFLMLSNTQFIENRVYDEEVEEPMSKPEAVERPPEQEKTREQKEAELIPKVQEAVNYGLRVLESAFEQLDIKAGNSDSEDEEVADRVEPILEPKDLYVDRPLPYLIGSQHFMEQDDVGLGDLSSEEMSIDSDRDSVIDSDEDKNDDQSDYQSEEGQGSIKKKSSIASDEDEEEDDEEEDSDIFGDSDKDENEDGKSSTGPSSFADELAARIKGEVPHKPEEDRASLKSSASATKRKSKGKKEPKAAKPQVAPDNDDMFSPPKMEDEDYSPFGGKGGLFSGGRGLFDDDDEGDLFSDAPKQEQRVASPAPAAKDPVSSKSNKKIPTGAVSIFPEGSLFGSPANGSDSLEDRENGGPAKPRPAPKQAPKQAPVGGLFDDDEDDDDFFSGSTLKKSASAGHEKPKQKKAVDLFGGDGDDEDDGDGDIFGEASGVPPSKQSPKEEETAAPAPEKKMPAGAISMFGPGTKNVLVEGLKRRQHSTSEESEKAEENVPGGDVAKPSPKPAGKPQTRGLFSDDEDTQIFPSAAKPQTKAEPVVQSKPSKALSIFDDEEEEDLFSSGPPKSKTNQAKSTSVQKPSKPVSSGLFSDDEDQWMSSKPSEAKPDVKTGGMRGSNSAPSSLPSARAAQKDSLFDEDDHDLFTATKETSKKKSQRVSLLFEEEEEDEEGRGSLFGFQPPAPKSSAPDVKATDAEPPSRVDEEKEKEEDTQSSPQESVEPKKKPAGAVSLFGGIDVLGQKEEVAKPTKTPLEDPDKDDFLYRDSPPPMDEEPRAKKNVVSLFDNDDEDEEEEEEAVSVSSQPAAKNTLKDQEQKTRTKSTRVFQDEELLFTQKLQKDNDPDVDLFSTSVNPASLPPSSVKAGAPMLFGDEDEDDLFSSAKPKAPPKVAEKPRIEEPPVKPVSLPVSGDAEKPTSPVKSKEPSSRIGKLQANLAISPAQLLPGAVPRMPGAVSVFPGLSPTSPSPPSFSSSSSSSSSALAQTPSPASSSAPQAGREGGVSFDGPAQVTTLQSTNKGRAKGAGRRRPQTRAARQLAAQLSDELREEGQEEAGSGGAGAGGAGSGAAPLTDAPPNPSALRLPIFPPAETQGAKPKKPRPPATTAPAAVEEDPFASGDLFAPASKQTPSPKPKSASPEQAPSQALKKEDVPAIFDNPGGDLFQAAKHKPAQKPKAAAFLEEEDHDIFGGGKSTTVTLTKEPPAESNPSKQDIFQDEKQEAPKKRKGKALDTSLFDDNVDIFADLTTTTKPKEKKSKKKVETKSIFDDDMDDIFSSGTVKPVVKPQSKSKKPQPSKDTTVAEETNHNIFDDPLNALGGN